jgi:peptide-methionine (R)-S-oxide reductase
MFTNTFSIALVALSVGLTSLHSCTQPTTPLQKANAATASANANFTEPGTPATIEGGLTFDPADTNWTERVEKSEDEWRKILPADVFPITRQEGTERAYSSKLYELKDKGMYYCVCCANPLFSSATKFHSGTGWPSFWQPYASKSVAIQIDNSHGMVREEAECARCGSHLGHVFDDGPAPTGLRYCMDGLSLHFVKSK